MSETAVDPRAMGRRRSKTRVVATCFVALSIASLGGCGWWSRWRSPSVAASAGPPDGPPPGSVQEARAACPNYDQVFATSAFPRDAFARGIDAGKATVRFNVDGSTIIVTRVTSTDSAFADDAVSVVRRLVCHVDHASTFEMAFAYRRDS